MNWQCTKPKIVGHKLRIGICWRGALKQRDVKQMGIKQDLDVLGFASVKSMNEEQMSVQQVLFMIIQCSKSLCLVTNHL